MKKETMFGIIIMIIISFAIMGTFLFLSGETYAVIDDEFSESEAKTAIVNEAYAYYYKQKAFRYDNHNITYFTGGNSLGDLTFSNSVWKRRSSYLYRPEDATLQDVKYLVCSEFIIATYYNTFLNALDQNYMIGASKDKFVWGTARMTLDSYIGNYDGTDSCKNETNMNVDKTEFVCDDESICVRKYCNIAESELGYDAIRHTIIDDMEPGDVIAFRRSDDSGHVMMYVGCDEFGECPLEKTDRYVLHATGSSYRYDSKSDWFSDEANGTVQKITLNEALDRAMADGNIRLTVLRPLKEIMNKGYKLSNNAQIRGEYANLVMEKTASVKKHESVNQGDIITYTISLKNKSNTITYLDIDINDEVPDNTSFISCTNNCVRDEYLLSWNNISIAPGGSLDYSYSVRVDYNVAEGRTIVNDKTEVVGIKLNTIETEVNRTLNKEMQDRLVATAKLWATDESENKTRFNHTNQLIQALYSDLLNKDDVLVEFNLNDYDGIGEIFNIFYDQSTTDDGTIYTLKANFDLSGNNYMLKSMFVPGLFGGFYTNVENQMDISQNVALNIGESLHTVLVDGRELHIDKDSFIPGDIVMVHGVDSKDGYASYLYLGDEEFAVVDDAEVEILNTRYYVFQKEEFDIDPEDIKNKLDNDLEIVFESNGEEYVITSFSNNEVTIKKKSDLNGTTYRRTTYNRLTNSLPGQDTFIVLRPRLGYLKGDVNLDGIVDSTDAVILARYLIEQDSEYVDSILNNGDMNNDGEIKINDVILLLTLQMRMIY